MVRPRQIATRVLRRTLAVVGHGVFSFRSFGHDLWKDVQSLSAARNVPIRTIFDVGANEGQTSLQLSQLFPDASIWAFEPSPATFGRLLENVAAHPAIKARELALGDDNQSRQLFEYDNTVLSSLHPEANYIKRFPQPATPRLVEVETVDRFCHEHAIGRINVLKVDTEGFDLPVLAGAALMLGRGAIDFICVEFNDIETDDGTGALGPMARLIRPFGYRFIASYNDYIVTSGEHFGVSNALFARFG
jgi:FkbM family methyltransferase